MIQTQFILEQEKFIILMRQEQALHTEVLAALMELVFLKPLMVVKTGLRVLIGLTNSKEVSGLLR